MIGVTWVSTGVVGTTGWVSAGLVGTTGALEVGALKNVSDEFSKLPFAVGKPGGTVHNRGAHDGLGDSARAVGDGQGGCLWFEDQPTDTRVSTRLPYHSYLGDGVGLCAVGDLCSGRAEGGVGSHDLSGVLDGGGTISMGSSDTSHEGSGGDE